MQLAAAGSAHKRMLGLTTTQGSPVQGSGGRISFTRVHPSDWVF